MNILGISAYHHDAAACLVQDGQIVAAAQEEWWTRREHDPSFPAHAIAYCLSEAGLEAAALDLVAFYDKPFLKFERLLETYLTYAPVGLRSFLASMPWWIKRQIWLPEVIRREISYPGRVLFLEHHESHAASAFFSSPFKRAAFLTADSVGEWTTTAYGVGADNQLSILADLKFPHSLGLLYSAFTSFCGFQVNSGEDKLMELAPYGHPRYAEMILDELMSLKEDGSFKLQMKYFNPCRGLAMTNDRFARLFGGPPRQPETPLTRRELDLAASIQQVTEEVLLRLARQVHRQTGEENLVLAGGVAGNCAANGRLVREGPFAQVWIQPAPGDAGGALGAALYTWHQYLGNPRPEVDGVTDHQQGSYLGVAFGDAEIEGFLQGNKIPYLLLGDAELPPKVSQLLAAEKVVGWFQGRMEFGRQALGSRSILGDARSPRMQATMNLKVKFRESFRPLAAAVLAERAADYFEIDRPSPYMLLAAPVRPELRLPPDPAAAELSGLEQLKVVGSLIPAVTQVDYAARVQTVHRETNPLFHRLLHAFQELTGCAVLANASFRVRGEPVVCTPEQAYNCFMRTEMDYLVMGRCLLDKTQQTAGALAEDWGSESGGD